MNNEFTNCVAVTLGKHFITLSCHQHLLEQSQPKILVFSGFVVDILGEWFCVTAGHIIQDIRKAIAAGATFDTWRLSDQTAGNEFNGTAIPYDFDERKWLAYDDREDGLDCAIVHLQGLCRVQLEAGGVTAIGQEAWSDHVTRSDHWALLGVPSESVAYDGKTFITARAVLVPLIPADTPPIAGAKSKNQFYARPSEPSDSYFTNPDGFSGGPVFSLVYSDEQFLYNLIGIQSSWYSESGVMAVCPFTTFAKEVEATLAEAFATQTEKLNASTSA